MKKSLLLLFFSLHMALAYGQIHLKGNISDTEGKALAYASIGIPGTEYGTISEENGDFDLIIKEPEDGFEILFAALGYLTQSRLYSTIDQSKPLRIQLSPKEITLEAITVSDKKIRPKSMEIGNGKSFLPRGMLAYDTLSGGSAMAILIDPNESKDLNYMTGVSLRIALSNLPQFKVRFRMMDVDESNKGKPGKDLLNENVIIKSGIRKGWLDFDLRPYALEPKEPFYMVFEWILDLKDRKYIYSAYEDFMTEYPKRVHYDTAIVDGEEIIDVRINELVAGTAFGVTGIKGKNEGMLTYTRSNSFGDWNRDNAVLSAKATFSNSLDYLPEEQDCENIECQIDEIMAYLSEEYPAPGLQFSLSKEGYNFYSKGVGYKDISDSSAVDRNTQFRIASVSKTMAAYAAYRASFEDSAFLDSPIEKLLADIPEAYKEITPRQLANHTAGVPDYKEETLDEIYQQKNYKNLEEALELFIDRPLVSAPGQSYFYSSYGFTILGATLEKASQLSYLDLLDSVLWKPTGMSSTYGDLKNSQPDKSKFYLYTLEEGPEYDLSYSYSSGGLISTTDNLVNFGTFLMEQGYFVSQAFTESLVQTNSEGIFYGLGWYMMEMSAGDKVYFHAGELPSSGSFILVHPDSGVVFALLANGPILYDENGDIPEPLMKIFNLTTED